MKKLLFVCSGNTCRSALAEGIAKKIFSDGSQSIQISSAGSTALEGMPASSLAIRVARSYSIDLTQHQARLLNRKLVQQADLIVTMGSKHRETVGVIEPSALDYTYLMTDFCDDIGGDVSDPIGMGLEEYQRTFDIVETCIRHMKEKLDTFDGWKK